MPGPPPHFHPPLKIFFFKGPTMGAARRREQLLCTTGGTQSRDPLLGLSLKSQTIVIL